VLNHPIQLIGPASPFGNSRETFPKSGTDRSNPVPSSREAVSLGISPLHGEREAALGVTAPPSILPRADEMNE
jgi:hypothetical protein